MTEIDRRTAVALGATALFAASGSALAADAPQDELRAFADCFFAAQNAHDAAAVDRMLLNAPEFLWTTPRGEVIWGHDPAMERFRAFYKGTWKIEPDMAQFRVMTLANGAVQTFVPLVLTAGPADQPARSTKIFLN